MSNKLIKNNNSKGKSSKSKVNGKVNTIAENELQNNGISALAKNKYTVPAIAAVALLAIIVLLVIVNPFKSKPKNYFADIEIKDMGTITVELNAEEAPITVANFVKLSKEGFYDGLTFHRIIEDFMMQGGDPDGNGLGGSGTDIKGEFSKNGVENNLSHTRGAISMARSDEYDSASSQFFIVHKDSTFLDGKYAAFGYVTSGMDIVDKICTEAEPTDGNGSIAKEDRPVINKITIRE